MHSAKPNRPIHAYAEAGQLEKVRTELDKRTINGTDSGPRGGVYPPVMSVDDVDQEGATALINACGPNAHPDSSQIIKLLLTSGANVNARDTNGRTALHHAADNNRADVFEALTKPTSQYPADIDLDARTTEWGDTALHIAAHHLHNHFVALLLEAGARKDIKNNDGESASDAATKSSFQHASAKAGDAKKEKYRSVYHEKKKHTLELLKTDLRRMEVSFFLFLYV